MKRNLLLGLAMAAGISASAALPTFSSVNMDLKVIPDGDSEWYFPEQFALGGAAFFDYNNDGWLDIAFCGRGYWSPIQSALLTNEKGTLKLTDNETFPAADWHGAFRVADFNNDGNVDLIMAAEGSWKLWLNDDAGNFTEVADFSTTHNNLIKTAQEKGYTSIFYIADMNNDGNQDIVTTLASSDDIKGDVVILEGDGTGKFTQKVLANTAFAGRPQLCVGDIDGDGLKDIILSGWISAWDEDPNRHTGIEVIMNNGALGYEAKFISGEKGGILRGGEDGSIILFDVNNDGKLDYLCAGKVFYDNNWHGNEALTLGINTGDRNNPFTEDIILGRKEYARTGLDWVDINGDGIVDFLCSGDQAQEVVMWLNDGTGTFKEQYGDMLGGNRGADTLIAADYTNDGHMDVMVMGYADDSKEFRIWKNKGDNTASPALAAPAAPAAVEVEGGVQFSWTKVDGAQLYNIYVKTKDGKLYTTIPADIETGFLKIANLYAGISTTSYTINGLALDNIESWGVQTINPGKIASAFATGNLGGVEGVEIDNNNAPVEYFNLQGVRVENPANGLYIKRQGTQATKVVL